jgi:hypothetical protein
MNTTAALETTSTNTPPSHVLEVIRTAEQELSVLLQQRAEIMRRVGTIKQMLTGMANLFGNSILDDELLAFLNRGVSSRRSGFTRACRTVLMESRTPLRARQGCQALLQRFPELGERHKDLAASITTVFNRLVDYAEARSFLDEHGVRVWIWATESGEGATNDGLANPEAAPESVLPA